MVISYIFTQLRQESPKASLRFSLQFLSLRLPTISDTSTRFWNHGSLGSVSSPSHSSPLSLLSSPFSSPSRSSSPVSPPLSPSSHSSPALLSPFPYFRSDKKMKAIPLANLTKKPSNKKEMDSYGFRAVLHPISVDIIGFEDINTNSPLNFSLWPTIPKSKKRKI